MLAGSMFYILSGLEVYDRLLRLIIYSLGVSLPVLLVLIWGDVVKRYFKRKFIPATSRSLEIVSGFIFIVSGALLLLV